MAREEVDLTGLSDDGSENDEDLRRAIALSLQDQERPSEVVEEQPPAPEAQQTRGTAFGSLMLDRKAMEEERLKRLAGKRPRSPGESDASEPASKKLASSTTTEKTVSKAPVTLSKSQSADSGSSPLQFPDGVVKKTWAEGYPREGDDIKIEEVLQKERLELAIISSFQWDDEWLMSKVNLGKTKVLLVAFAADDDQKLAMKEHAPPNVRFSFPPMKGPGSMHSKLQVLKFPTHIRIVVPTGNMVPHDWGESGVMENMVFLIDLPRLADATEHKPTAFSSELFRFLRACQVDEKLVDSLTNYDFSRTERLGFVHTIPGGHTDELRKHTGYCGLGDTVTRLGLATKNPIDVDIICASLGSINSSLVESMYNACQGDNGMKEYTARTTRKPAAKPASGPSQTLREHLRIYFPTEQTVASSRGGRGAAGTICVQARWWRSPTFPTALVRDCVSKPRTGILMHSKLIFVRGATSGEKTSGGDDDDSKAWAYVGSANLSESAWGRLVKDSKSGKPKMSCRNWECGVVLPVINSPSTSDATAAETASSTSSADGLDAVFAQTVPVPMVVPGRPYGPDEEPWFYAGSR